MMVFDSHMHVGQFYENYHSPEQIIQISLKLGIERMAISSTTVCAGDYDLVLTEIKTLLRMNSFRVVPVLWLTTRMIDENKVDFFLNSGIKWKCIKIHGVLDAANWTPTSRYMKIALALAQQLQVPLLLHTGEYDYVTPLYYQQMIEQHQDQQFILAHSRPVNQTIDVLKVCPNAWADTAFTPIECVKLLVDKGFVDRILWGSDLPIVSHFYPTINYKTYYDELLESLLNAIGPNDFAKITRYNFSTLFG